MSQQGKRTIGLSAQVDTVPDETLLAGLAVGDQEIGVAFVQRFQNAVFGVALAVVGDSGLAEDVAQRTFEHAWRHAQIYDSRRGSVRTWVTTIARNLAIDLIRVRRPVSVDPDDLGVLVDAVRQGPEQRAPTGEACAELRRAIAVLPIDQVRAIVLAGIYGMAAKEVAQFERIPLGTAKTRIRTAMGKLRGAPVMKRANHG